MSILIVDDSEDMRNSTRTLLELAGHTDVVTAASAQAAFDLLGIDSAAAPPAIDVILMDVVMPKVDGIEACRRIKAQRQLRDIPIIMLTGRAEENDLAAAFAAGAIDYITKPVKVIELLARLRSALALKHEFDERRRRQSELMELTRQLREANLHLEQISTQDPLTGIANRRFFTATLAREWARAIREGVPISVIMIDVDHFKDYNDRYGHPQGDECLRTIAQTLRGRLRRPGDLLARYGGEEFVTLLTQTGSAGARAVAEAFRASVESLRIEHVRVPLQIVTISLGVATTIPQRQANADTLVEAADQALYDAKRAGRNRVVAFDASPAAQYANITDGSG